MSLKRRPKRLCTKLLYLYLFTFISLEVGRISQPCYIKRVFELNNHIHNGNDIIQRGIILTIVVLLYIIVFVVVFTPFNVFDNSGYSQILPSNSNVSSVDNNSLPIKSDLKNTSLGQLVPKEEKIEGNKSLSNSTSNITTLNRLSSTANSSGTPEMMIPQVKITSHTKNQKVPAGTLTINGISSDNPSKICDVYVILNSIKPYQKVTPDGQNGQNSSSKDYSTWKFTFLPTYALISEGDNKMTAKIDCIHGATNSTKFNSLNVTGVDSSITTGDLLISKKSAPLVEENAAASNGVSPAGNATSSPITSNPHSEQLTEVPHKTDGITPNPTYLGITPSSPLSNGVSPQNSSIPQSQHENNPAYVEGQFAGTEQLDPVDKERSVQTKKIVDKFIDKVQDTVEKRLEELITTRTPFKLVTPHPFETEGR